MDSKQEHSLTNQTPEFVGRRLALEVRSRRFGFAVFQGEDLVDFGARYDPGGNAGKKLATKNLAALVNLYMPSVVVARRTRRTKHLSSTEAARALANIRAKLRRMNVRFVLVQRRDVRELFASNGCRNKHDVATFLAERFAPLKSRLPRRRKTWEPERHIFVVFDAVATGVAFTDTTVEPATKAA